jgi:hypothetical protein
MRNLARSQRERRAVDDVDEAVPLTLLLRGVGADAIGWRETVERREGDLDVLAAPEWVSSAQCE